MPRVILRAQPASFTTPKQTKTIFPPENTENLHLKTIANPSTHPSMHDQLRRAVSIDRMAANLSLNMLWGFPLNHSQQRL